MTVIHNVAPKTHIQIATMPVPNAYHPFTTPVPSNPSMFYPKHLSILYPPSHPISVCMFAELVPSAAHTSKQSVSHVFDTMNEWTKGRKVTTYTTVTTPAPRTISIAGSTV